MKKQLEFPKAAKALIGELEKNGYEAFFVGGAVRDLLLGNLPGDLDITTSATPDEMKAVFKEYRVIETGIRHGTLTVISDSVPYEITSYRIDGEYSDSRHPETVNFTRSLREDLSRRDFTVNAMAYNDRVGVVDLFSGREDLEKRTVRAVGDPERRFTEDALRILRALRFASVLDFLIEPETERKIRELSGRIKLVSRERIFAEWMKLLGGAAAYRIISGYSDLISDILYFPGEVKLPDESRFASLNRDLRQLAIFAESFGRQGADIFYRAMEELHSEKERRESGRLIISALFDLPETRLGVKLSVKYLGYQRAEELAELRYALSCSDAAKKELRSIIERGDCCEISSLRISGKDLLSLGYRGKEIGDMLNLILDAVMREELENEREALISFAVKQRSETI